MSAIYKFPIELNAETETMYVKLPRNAKVISILVEDIHKAYIYALVDSKEEKMDEREVLWLGAEWKLSEEQESKIEYYTFLGTHKIQDLVWHFWIVPDEDFTSNPFYF